MTISTLSPRARCLLGRGIVMKEEEQYLDNNKIDDCRRKTKNIYKTKKQKYILHTTNILVWHKIYMMSAAIVSINSFMISYVRQ